MPSEFKYGKASEQRRQYYHNFFRKYSVMYIIKPPMHLKKDMRLLENLNVINKKL
jgi:CMP-N-acetylneuraminic acid synthetase